MKVAYYVKKKALKSDGRVAGLISRLEEGGAQTYSLESSDSVVPETDMILSFGGDGTFLSAARVAASSGVPILGVNMGRLGFLSSHTPDEAAEVVLSGEFQIEERGMLAVRTETREMSELNMLALNEMAVQRVGAAMLGVDVAVGGTVLPTIWADGLLVSTSSGSTAYNLSAGGPICTPDADVLIITPIAPHNLNVRPLIVPDSARLTISMHSREALTGLSVDNLNFRLSSSAVISVSLAPVRLKVVRIGKSEFINALRSRLLWGVDVRNNIEQY